MMRYVPPRLNELIRIRNPQEEPTRDRDAFGAPTDDEPVWGIEVWASKRDQAPFTEIGESIQVRAGRTVFTIRKRDGIRADAEIVDSGGIIYSFVGAPIERGGNQGRMAARYYEIFAERRQAE